MSKPINQIKENKEPKTFKDSFTNTNYKRPFILEKILKDLHCKNLINKNKDPLIKKKKKLRKIKLPNKLKIKEEINKDSLSKDRTPFLYLIPNLENFKRKINIPINKQLNRQRSDLDLPMITKHKLKNQGSLEEEKTTMTFFYDNNSINSKDEGKNKEKLIESEILNAKDLYKNRARKMSICSFMNKLPGDKSLQENYKIIKDINIINDKYNLNLNLNHNKSNSTSKIFDNKKYNISGMLNKLFQYYSSETKNTNYKNNKCTSSINYKNNSSSLFDNIENKQLSKYENSDSGNNTIELMKESYEDDSNTFLTKLKNYPQEKKINFDISKLIKRRCSLSDIKRNNIQVIDNDKRIGIHCLLSKVQREISLKKILYKYIDKTLYELEDDPMYKRIKIFEENIKKIIKKEY